MNTGMKIDASLKHEQIQGKGHAFYKKCAMLICSFLLSECAHSFLMKLI
jgi:hypothetical protein